MEELSYSILCDANVLLDAFDRCKKNVIYKESFQRYEANLFSNINNLKKKLESHTYKQSDFYRFIIHERGSIRPIRSLTSVDDRIVQSALCTYFLIPILKKYLIYDNGACISGRGLDFNIRRIKKHLHDYYRTYGTNEGYVLLIDWSKFYDNVLHSKLLELLREKIQDDDVYNLLAELIDSFKIDASDMTDEEYRECSEGIFILSEHFDVIQKSNNPTKYIHKSLGFGSEISQICGVFFPYLIDNLCKIVYGMKFYGRYMDDTYIICDSKEKLLALLEDVEKQCNELGIHLNLKKTRIEKIDKYFKFLKKKFKLTDTGKVVTKPAQDTFTRERRKLKKLKEKLNNKEITYKEIENHYKSWRGNFKKFNCYHRLGDMDELFDKLFIEDFVKGDYGRR